MIRFDPRDTTKIIRVGRIKWATIPNEIEFRGFLPDLKFDRRIRKGFLGYFSYLDEVETGCIMSLEVEKSPLKDGEEAGLNLPMKIKAQIKFSFEYLANFWNKTEEAGDQSPNLVLLTAHPINIMGRKNLINLIFYEKPKVIYFFLLDFTMKKILKSFSISMLSICNLTPIAKKYYQPHKMSVPVYCKQSNTLFCLSLAKIRKGSRIVTNFTVTNPYFKQSVNLLGNRYLDDDPVSRPVIWDKKHFFFEKYQILITEVVNSNFLLVRQGDQHRLLHRKDWELIGWGYFARKLENPGVSFARIYEVNQNLAALSFSSELYLIDFESMKVVDCLSFHIPSFDSSKPQSWRVVGRTLLKLDLNGTLSIYDFSHKEAQLLRKLNIGSFIPGSPCNQDLECFEVGIFDLVGANLFEDQDSGKLSPVLLFSFDSGRRCDAYFSSFVRVSFNSDDSQEVISSKIVNMFENGHKNDQHWDANVIKLNQKIYTGDYWVQKVSFNFLDYIALIDQDLKIIHKNEVTGSGWQVRTLKSGLIYFFKKYPSKKARIFKLIRGGSQTKLEEDQKGVVGSDEVSLSVVRNLILEARLNLDRCTFVGFHIIYISDSPKLTLKVRDPLSLVVTSTIEFPEGSRSSWVEFFGVSKTYFIVQFKRDSENNEEGGERVEEEQDSGVLDAWLVNAKTSSKSRIDTFGMSRIISVQKENGIGDDGSSGLYSVYFFGESLDYFLKGSVEVYE